MTNRKTTRRALFMSVISLMLCCAMLVGTTFAWFTDEVTSVNNVITAGNLDVELYYKNGANSSYAAVGSDPLFSSSLWEPGHVEMVNLKVSNLGTLALKYQLNVSVISEKGGINKAGDDFLLSDYIRYAVLDGDNYATREAAVAAAGQGTAVNGLNWTKSNTILAKGADQVVTLVVWMPETVTNEANYKTGTEAPEITLGINLYATQVENEFDSFGKDYDEDAWVDGFDVYTEQDLNAAIANGETAIDLMGDIKLTKSLEIPVGTTLSLNLNGKTLENEEGYAFESKGNLTISGEGTIAGKGGIRATAGTLIINGGNYYGDSDWNNGTYQHAIKAENANVVINGGNFDATVNGQTNAMLNASENATITINGGTFKNVEGELPQFAPYIATYEKNGKIVINDGTFYGGWRFNGETATTDIKGGTFTVGFDGQSFHADSTHVVTVSGGTFVSTANAKLTDKVKDGGIVASGYKAVETADGWMVIPETSNYVSTSDGLVAAINAADDGDTILIAAGNYDVKFTNNTSFNVDNLTIEGMGTVNLNVDSTEVSYGRIQGDNVVFNNINFTDATVGATGKATYNNCSFAGRLECASGAGETFANNCTMNDVHTSGDMTAGNAYFKECTMNVAEYGMATSQPTLTFEKCTIGKLTPWDVQTVLIDCEVSEIDASHMEDNEILINGAVFVADGLYKNGNTYYVESANGLKYFSAKALTGNNSTAETAVIELQADIDLAGADFSSIVAQRGDTLTINGNGHTISNVNIISGADDNTTGQAGMFYCYPNSTLNVSNLILKDIVVTAEESDSGYGAAVVGFCEGAAVLNNVDVVSATVKGAKSSGMLAGHVGNGGSLTATDCDLSGSVTLSNYEANGHYAGKYIGTVAGNVTLDGCTANVTVGGNLNANNKGDVYGRMTADGAMDVLTTTEEGLVLNNDTTLYLVPDEYAEDTVYVPEGVTAVGNYAFAYNSNVETVVLASTVRDLGRGFDSSTVKKVVLNEGLETISSRAFKATTALEEVVIPTTVKEIADNAFQKSAIKEIVIPASVKTIGEAAFGSSKIEKVTFEGNTSIQGYAFRGCPNLKEVYLNGENVTFIASTLNGRNSCWFCNGESNNPNTSNITFHVVNETVAARVKAAMGAEAANTPVYVNGVLYEG